MSTANAAPAKRFFVEMLVRDIELDDAILDLLDNCVDGAMRSNAQARDVASLERPYEGYWAEIELDADRFRIRDNCGGIDVELAKASAFRLGRKDENLDEDIPTVGLYGIGMKRAIFKLGSSAVVRSAHGSSYFEVAITPEWLADDEDWNLELNESAENVTRLEGTEIEVSDLREGVKRTFASASFLPDFVRAVETYYAYIIEKGFSVRVNGNEIVPKKIKLLFGALEPGSHAAAIAPYVYSRDETADGVSVLLTVGLYQPLPSEEDEDQLTEGRASSEQAGWTIICNDRVVVYADKSRMTGWGEANVPGYHTQFTSIAGVVIFRSSDPSKLPLTTTKRGVDGNSDLYLQVKEFMREGVKTFTDYTNRWKKRSEERRAHQENARAMLPEEAMRDPSLSYTTVRRPIGGKKSIPVLPVPNVQTDAWIRFAKPLSQIEVLSQRFFGHSSAKPSEVGAHCFSVCYGEE